MPESITHQKLKMDAKNILLSKGYAEEKIFIDTKRILINYHGHSYPFRPDAYASNGRTMVIECGNFPNWRRAMYEYHFGKDNIIHLPFPAFYGRYRDKIDQDNLNSKQQKDLLIDTYIKQIYDFFKDDPVFDFLEFKDDTRDLFDVDNHRAYREINPDYGDKPETDGKTVWMNFPSSKTVSKIEYKKQIHWGMLYYGKNICAITIIFSGKEACEKFLSLRNQDQIYEALKKLPSKFHIRDGSLFWEKKAAPPYDKEWNDPITCNELTNDDYEKILSNLENLINMQKNGFRVGPVLDLAKGFFKINEIPEAISALKELYSILLRSQTKIDEIAEKIKVLEKTNRWEWYISEPHEWNYLYKIYIEKFNEDITLDEFKKACRKLRSDPDYAKWVKS